MGSKNKKTWDAIFTDPVKADIEWHDIESLFVTAGAEITEGNESRVRVKLKGIRAFDMFFLDLPYTKRYIFSCCHPWK